MCFMHELKQLVYNCFQELPMGPQESWILSNNIPGGCKQFQPINFFTNANILQNQGLIYNFF